MIGFTDDATEQQKKDLYNGLARMPQIMDFIQRYEFGPDLGLRDDNLSMALVADFDSEEDWRDYSTHPAHLDLIDKLVRPITASTSRVQYEVS